MRECVGVLFLILNWIYWSGKNSVASENLGVGNYICRLTGLTPNTTYYVKAFAENDSGIVYGETLTFTTLHKTYSTNIISFKCE